MRKAKGLPSDCTRGYIPDVDVNRSDPTPVTIQMRQITEGQRRKIDWEVRKELDNGKGESSRLDMADAIARKMFFACVESVENYVDNRGRPILTAEDLWEHGESEIVWAVIAEIQASLDLDPVEKKT